MKAARLVGAVLLAACLAGARPGAQAPQASGAIRVLPVRGNVYVLAGAGANVVASVGKDGVLLVDSGPAAMAEVVRAAVENLSRQVTSSRRPQQSCVGVAHGCAWWNSSELLPTIAGPPPPRPTSFLVNTSADPDHVGGNAVVGTAGQTFGVRNLGNVQGAWILAHDNVTLRLSRAGQDVPVNETFSDEKKLNFFNGEAVVITHRRAAHTDGDSVVYFRGSEVLAVGDILNMTSYPVIDVERGGTIQGVVDALNWMLDVAVVEHMMEGGTLIVPGHGRIVDAADLAYYRDMMTIVRDRIVEMKRRGMTLAQIKAARPTRDYDGRFGKNPDWTPEMFAEAAYRSLKD